MPRNKKGATRGRAKTRGGGGRKNASHTRDAFSDDDEMDFIPFAAGAKGALPSRGHDTRGSLRHEALNTQRHHNWTSDTKLRNSKVDFVSAGDLAPTTTLQRENDTETAEALADMSIHTHRQLDTVKATSPPFHYTPAETEDEACETFVIDTAGTDQPIITGLSQPRLRSFSSTPSDSSEEVILFKGRDSAGRGLRRLTPPPSAHQSMLSARIRTIDDRIHADKALLAHMQSGLEQTPERLVAKNKRGDPHENNSNVPIDASDKTVAYSPNGRGSHFGNHKTPEHNGTAGRGLDQLVGHIPSELDSRTERLSALPQALVHGKSELCDIADMEQALIDDYIANMEDDEMEGNSSFMQRPLGLDGADEWVETDSSDAVDSRDNVPRKGGWDREDIEDFDDLSTSDEMFGTVEAILSKRDRPSGLQYLVTWEGMPVDEARWILHTNLCDAAANQLIEQFEAEEKLVAEFFDDDAGDSSGEDSDLDGITGDDSDGHDDEADLLQRAQDRMTDEKIARLLAKQEELGMGSDELLLFDDEADEDDVHTDAMFFQPKRKTRRGIRGPNQATGDFPRASALADAYDGFDIMDFERPSLALPKKSKRRKGKLILDSEVDSELEDSMQLAWEHDRMRKRERKEEREELRALGMLGKKKGKPALTAKYKEGMSLSAINDEIRAFLIGGNTTLALPPMDKADRKVVHEIANAFNVKSKSAGAGKKRFPVLYRTSRTIEYKEHIFSAVESRFTRRFLPRMDVKGKKPARTGGGGRGGFAGSGVSYRDGDVVGASAPELSTENKGRKMLEMMGWSSGTALGAINNKGILQPVSHVVKTTKAGLG